MDDDRMSLSSESSSDFYDPSINTNGVDPTSATDTIAGAQRENSAPKRVLDDDNDEHAQKRAKTEAEQSSASPAEHLPAEIWQHIFSFLSPLELAKLMQIKRNFNDYLDGSIDPGEQFGNGVLRTVHFDSIWARWRIANVPNMPKPLEGTNERFMWKLIRGFRCELCGKLDVSSQQQDPNNLWHGGPSMGTTRAIWPFGLRCCGECLYKSCEKDTVLLCSDVKQFMSALPYAFLTHDWHYVLTTVRTESGPIPHGVHLSKQYLRHHIDQIREQMEEHSQSQDKAAVDEWSKGLSGLGKRTMNDAARWERWESKGGLVRVNFMLAPPPPQMPSPNHPPMGYPSSSQPWAPNQFGWNHANSQPQFFQPQPVSMAQSAIYHPPTTAPNPYFQTSPVSTIPNPFAQPDTIATPQNQTPGNFGMPPPTSPPTQQPQQRIERNEGEAKRRREERKAAILQRCANDIDPPLFEGVARHMDSFKAAIQISAPLTDSAWEVLKPRLLAQRPAAEELEIGLQRQLQELEMEKDAQNRRNNHSKDARDAQEREWEEALQPQREALSSYADQFVGQHWTSSQGKTTIVSGNAARFAISLFNHVRKKFYTDLEFQDMVFATAGQPVRDDSPDGPFLRRLTLETMKWVNDHKIRPLTRDFPREIFSCSGEGCESNSKQYAFEGVIQHYGAKHTNNFSKGNVIVHWQTADWPEDLPFHDSSTGPLPVNRRTNGGFSRGTTITPQVTSGAPFSVPSLTTSPYTPLSGYQQGPFPPPINGFGPNAHNFQYSATAQGTHGSASIAYDPKDLSQFFSKGGVTNLTSPTTATSGTVHTLFSAPIADILNALGTKPPNPPAQEDLDVSRASDKKSAFLDTEIPDFELYQEQLRFIAETARSAWNSLRAIPTVPQSVRVFAVIHNTVSLFRSRFDVNLSLETFTAALTNNTLLEPLRSADELHCHLCALHQSSSQESHQLDQPQDLTHLVSHFKSIHIDGNSLSGNMQRNNWATSMIALPSGELIAGLITIPGITDERLALLADAFPDLLPYRVPRPRESDFRPKQRNGRRSTRKFSNRRNGSEEATDLEGQPNSPRWEESNSKSDPENGYQGFQRHSRSPPGASGRRRTPKLYDEKMGDEYDPSRPALPQSSGKRDHRRDPARKRSGADADLAQLIMSASAESQRAAEEENARRGIIPEARRTEKPGKPVFESAAVAQRLVGFPSGVHEDDTQRLHYSRPVQYETDRRAVPYADHVYRSPQRDYRQDRVSPADEYHLDRAALHHLRPVEHHEDDYRSDEPISRSRSTRFARYDEQERLLKGRSRSPSRFEEPGFQERSYRQPREPLLHQVPARTSPVHHRYAEDREPLYVDEFGRPVRLVPVRDQPPSRYTGHTSDNLIEYVEPQPAYDDRRYPYYEGERGGHLVPDPRYDTRSLPMAQQPIQARDARYVH